MFTPRLYKFITHGTGPCTCTNHLLSLLILGNLGPSIVAQWLMFLYISIIKVNRQTDRPGRMKQQLSKQNLGLSPETCCHTLAQCPEPDTNRYRISGIFHVGLIFAEFTTSLKVPNIDTAKNKPYYTSSLRVLEIAKIGLSLSENLTHLPSRIFAKISRREKFLI